MASFSLCWARTHRDKEKERNNDKKKEKRGTKRQLGAEGEKGKLSLLKLFNETSCIANQKEEQGEGERNVKVEKNVGEKSAAVKINGASDFKTPRDQETSGFQVKMQTIVTKMNNLVRS